MRISLVLVLVVCFLQVGSSRKSSGGSSRGSIGGGGWSSGGSRGSSSGGGWGSSSRGSGSVGGGGWSSGGNNRGNVGGGGWNFGGSSSSNSGSSGTGKKKGILGGLFGRKNKDPSTGGTSGTSGGKKGLLGGLFGKKKNTGGFSTKKKGGKLKTLKKAAIIGAAAYGGYKLGKLTSRFSNFGHGHNFGYGFNDWNRWRSQDGFLCRNNMDCTWIDPSLECDDYEFDFSPSNLWFGGDVASIRGQCECKNNFFWNDDDLHCLRRGGLRGGSVGQGLTGLAIGLLVAGLMMCCCCVVGCVFVVRMIMGRSSE